MNEWCMAHPYLTFFLLIFASMTFTTIVTDVLKFLKKPDPPPPPPNVHFNVGIPEVQNKEEDPPSQDDFN
jgi:hypothetical protein